VRELLREAWLTVEPADYEQHMAGIGQAQANAGLMAAWLAAVAADETVLVAGAGTGQMFDFLAPEAATTSRMVFTDLNPVFLAKLRERLGEATTLVDDIEATQLPGAYPHAAVTLVLEHVDWRRAIHSFRRWQSRRVLTVIQENPANLASAVTPGRTVPGTMNVFRERAHPELVPLAELTAAMADLGYTLEQVHPAPVSDGKRMLGCWFVSSALNPGS
jgi:threonine dehydrogenase-like Zn-dependent dehydrogenase